MSKKNILVWLVVILVVLNAVTIGTILYHNYNERKEKDDRVVVNANGEMINGRYMREQLGFDNEQVEQFREANFNFRHTAFATIAAIDSLKMQMFDELKKPGADSVRVYHISDLIGEKHADLKKRTADFYLKIKSICTAEQISKLESVFAPLFNNEGIGTGPRGGRMGQGRGPGWRRLQDSINQ